MQRRERPIPIAAEPQTPIDENFSGDPGQGPRSRVVAAFRGSRSRVGAEARPTRRTTMPDDRQPQSLLTDLSPDRHLDLVGRRHEPWVRRAVLVLLLALVALGLANVFGQKAATSSAAGAAAELTLEAPDRLRGGVLGQGTIRVDAAQRVAQPRLVLDEGWIDGMTINTISPEAADQGTDDGRPVLSYDELPAGDSLTVRISYQVNPTTIGSRPGGVVLLDGDREIARVNRTIVVFP